ncbi:serine protease [Staphylococcus hyicus]|uniref:Serine protease n=2 Tax=Staphylococcus hyicus TaxID=1284 RepID=Q8GNJ7_STAHY|nr:trypsin-like peptidase domain-containing protein [Staphylococcus hyicus]AAN32970.1 exfoliative toxin ExhA [Staphylococcus hyicus]AFK29619.1 exfoliative toxin ExhA [Staphylococcus hyicus]AFK29620.1 exfoliative toxin ExhA [Staphylococcus hyicus]AFK29622.1 exfoliative toxin ExhA [Staphylococcus hyicus]AJC95797.1 exfoliative toxin ExhA [Staphylococcus hyicus]
MNKTLLKKTLVLLTLATVAPMSLQALETPIKNNIYASELSKEEHIEKWNSYNKQSPLGQSYFSKVNDTTQTPYQAVGSLFIKNKPMLATGFVVSQNKIITNYHVAREAKNNPENVKFRPGLTKNSEGKVELPFGEFEAETIDEAPFGAGIDIAIIKLKPNKDGKNIGEVVEPLKFGNAEAVGPHQVLRVVGYPNNTTQFSMYSQKIEVHSTKQGLKYFGYTEEGNSGSPILDDENNLVGIHAGRGGFDDGTEILVGHRFEKSLLKELKQKINN